MKQSNKKKIYYSSCLYFFAEKETYKLTKKNYSSHPMYYI